MICAPLKKSVTNWTNWTKNSGHVAFCLTDIVVSPGHTCKRALDAGTFLRVPTRSKPSDKHKFKVGDRVSVTLHTGQLADGTVRAIVDRTDGAHLQV
jgi:hypothetical protein